MRCVAACVAMVLAARLGFGLPSRIDDSSRFEVPEGLLLGAAVMAVQTEGAWNASGKSESAADRLFHTLRETFPESHDTAADSYHRYKEDVAMAAQLKLKLFKFSMSWSRILPTADATKNNSAGVQFYHDLIKEIKSNGMTPMVMMNNLDHPQILEDQFQGWQSPKMIEKFTEYAGFLFDEYGQEVPLWASINEPIMYCSYFNILFARAKVHKTATSEDMYTCIYHTILAHKEAYKIFKEGRQRGKYVGQLGFTALLMYAQPASTSAEDVYASHVYNQVLTGTLLNPVVHGDYPQISKDILGSKLPQFTPGEKTDLIDSTDFIGLNVYFDYTVGYKRANRSVRDNYNDLGFNPMLEAVHMMRQDLPFVEVFGGQASFSDIRPEVMKAGLLWTHSSYKKPVIICENGFGDINGYGVHDHQRAAYHSAALRTLVTTVKDFGVKVLAYNAWSLIDSFEFTAGYSRPFGLVHVDYKSGSLNRTLKDSSSFWIEMADTGVVPHVQPEGSTTASPATPTTMPTPSTPMPSSSAGSGGSLLLLAVLMLYALQ
ncbi:hypothetical protein ONE63_007318 [Megalurothrips usitatus]|uniref:Myrosinase 1-like n=1 Tax=Megalurothrips usitatus TaxID=439358 RepID=A0AAV7XRP6_9NEOP|nr:hypothetical protein ONE63_007318 [Megalurothrips usitatus]